MTRTGATALPAPGDTPGHAPAGIPHRVALALLCAGAAACLAGLVHGRLWDAWRPGRFGELVLLAGLSAGLAWGVRRASGCTWATGHALAFCTALLVFAGPLPVAAVLLFALAASACGGLVAARAPLALQCACGLALVAGLLGWLLPLPLHLRAAYLLACVAAIALRWRALRAALRDARLAWSGAVAAHPRAAAWAALALGLASTGAWLPTLQVDDLGYHLRLPWELQLRGAYAPDPWRHVWAVAPWASDVQHAVAQVLAGGEARGALNALWIAVAAAGVWRIARTLGGTPRAAWAAVALYASLPLTAALAAGMQTETAATALLAWLAWLVLDREHARTRLLAGAVLAGGLLGLKLMSGAQALLLLAWAAWQWRTAWPWRWLLPSALVVLAVGASSYMYGAVVAGNPFLPLFNATFHSPYFAGTDFNDARWQAGIGPLLPWHITFDTARYHEGFAGAAGFVLVALAGAWVLALADARTRGLALVATLMLAATWLPLQYLRYAFPALVLLLPCLAVAIERHGRVAGGRLLVATCVLNLAFQANAHWMLRTGALKQTVLALGNDAPLFAQYAPERALLQALRDAPHGDVLALDADRPWVAELGTRGRMLAWYDPTLQRQARRADADASGAAWVALLRGHGITDVIVREAVLPPARRAALQRLRATPRATVGGVAWWRIAGEAAP